MAYTKPANLFASTVLNAPVAGDVSLSNGFVIFTGIAAGFRYKDINRYRKTAYSAGVAQVNTIDLALITVADNTVYSLTVQKNVVADADYRKTYTVISGTAATAASIRTQFVNAIQGDAGRFVSAAAGGGSTFTLTEILTTESRGFIVTDMPAGATNTATTPHTTASGTVAEVLLYDSAAAGTFAKYEFDVWREAGSAGNSGNSRYLSKYVVWANEGGAGFAAFDAAVSTVVTGAGTAAEYIAIV